MGDEFVKATMDNTKQGSIVRGNQVWGHGPHVYHDREYVVSRVGSGVSINLLHIENCSYDPGVKPCRTCTVEGRHIDLFEVKLPRLTEEEIRNAVPLPSADEALRFWKRMP